jgi:hypothetical protein
MLRYRFSLLRAGRTAVDIEERDCSDDLDAIDQAEAIWKKYIIEIRQESAFIARVKPGDQPPNERDPVSFVYPPDVCTLQRNGGRAAKDQERLESRSSASSLSLEVDRDCLNLFGMIQRG